MLNKKILLFFIALTVGSICLSFTILSPSYKIGDITHQPNMRGVCWVGGDSITYHNYDPLVDVGGNWISQTPFGWMDGYDNPVVHLNAEKAWWGEADRGISHSTKLAHEKGLSVMLKPHIWLMNSNGKWRHDIEMNSAEEWEQWFKSYETFILHYAQLAADLNIESLCIGAELYKTTSQHPDKWRHIIQQIREVYCGTLTYGANWYKEYEEITFWDDLDFIGIQSYFPLTKKENPSVAQLVKGWQKHKKDISKIAKKYNKNVVFTEVGFKNSADAAIEPWTWPQKLASDKMKRSDQTQINCYQAMFEALWNEPWVDGFFIWKWFHTTHKYADANVYWEEREARRAEYYKQKSNQVHPKIYFSPQRTGAIEVLKKWYSSKNLSK